MRRLLLVGIALALAVSACSPDEAGESTTSLSATTSTSSSTTTSPTEPTTTSLPPTTTTTAASTTTTEATTTTTTPGLEGTWADEPLIVAGFGALGWWDGSDWIMAEDAGALPVVGGEDYQIAKVGLQAITTAGPQTLVCEPLNNIGVELDNEELLGDWPGPYGVAISAPWDIQPHLFEEIPDDGTYAGFAAELLSTRGLDVASPVIKQLFRTDLEGDGVNEVLVVAEDLTDGLLLQEGDYSIIFLRKVVEGDVQTAVLGETVVLPGDDEFEASYSVGAVADLSGDGKMEIVVSSGFFEGLSVQVHEYVNDDLGPVIQLEVGCGS